MVTIDDSTDRRRRLSRTRNMSGAIFVATIVAISIGEWPLLMVVLGVHALIWLCYTLMLSADLHECRLVDDTDLHKSRLG